ncbi:zinc-dependent metalloprotease [Desmospora profundinema]|uniref:Uncharacterized protein n=1 Tax=Desmospora profundinema TaxID=1571184 RepID=A0ABU1ILP8_9BACL|nr:zinc-dependent metalloprotease [Desmospora profundinema]MDR6225706.1 hypothetical protein [Desmospora profundinema]
MKNRLWLCVVVTISLLISSNIGISTAYASGQSDGSIAQSLLGFFERLFQDRSEEHTEEKVSPISKNEDMIADPLPEGAEIGKRTLEEEPTIERSSIAKVHDKNGNVIGRHTLEKNIGEGQNASIEPQSPGSHVLTAIIAVDEEYRSAYPDWQDQTAKIVEQADQAFNRDHDIDIQVKGFMEWDSNGGNGEQLLNDLTSQSGQYHGSYDFVIGFTKDPRFNYGGIAWLGPQNGTGVSITADMNADAIWRVLQHELSHNFGLPHDEHGPNGPKCIMNYYYTTKIDYWDQEHNELIQKNKSWYGNKNNGE